MEIDGDHSGNERFASVSDLVSQFFWVTFTKACQEAFKTFDNLYQERGFSGISITPLP